MLNVHNQEKVKELLVEKGIFSDAKLEELLEVSESAKKPFLDYLLDQRIIEDEALTKVIAEANNIPYVNLVDENIDPAVLKTLDKNIAERYMAVPLGEEDGRLAVGMLDADNIQAIDFLAQKIDKPLKVYMASKDGINHVLGQYRTDVHTDVSSAVQNFQANQEAENPHVSASNIKTIVQDSPISRALSTILEYAAQSNASDVHIEPTESELRIRARIDGILRQVMTLPKDIEPALISRIKILSNLKIDEHRVPQDGQFTIAVVGREVDLRIAVSPVVWGEKVVIRLLDKSNKNLSLEDLGFQGAALKAIKEGAHQPNGMILSSGPTGSGKSTTLYALINEIKSDEINIITLEDPVEYKMQGVNQIQVNADVGLTFASGLRSILRQDPDVVMVGEIRDKETANLAVQAALTGHLVFSTLHTNSAAGVLPRLIDMGIEPFLIASTVNTVIGQRLVRRLTPDKQKYESTEVESEAVRSILDGVLPPSDEEVEEYSDWLGYDTLPLSGEDAYTLFKGTKSQKNPNGYKGRMGVYEVFSVTDELEKLILKQATTSQIQHQAQLDGMITMRQDGYLKALAGITTLDEVNRVAAEG